MDNLINDTKVSEELPMISYEGQTLYITYTSGQYSFEDVPRQVYLDLLAATDKNTFITEALSGKYICREVSPIGNLEVYQTWLWKSDSFLVAHSQK